MKQSGINQLSRYLRKMAIDGLIIQTEITDIKVMNKELSQIGRNINQIAKRINTTGSVYQEDLVEIKGSLKEIWRIQRRILSNLP